MSLTIRHYRPYTPPAKTAEVIVFHKPVTDLPIKKGAGGRPKGYYQPKPARFEELLEIEIRINPALTREDFMGSRKLAHMVEARRRVAMALYHKHGWSGAQISRVMKRDPSTIYSILGIRRASKYFGSNDL